MKTYRSNDLDHFWLYLILIHVIGSYFISFMLNMPYGLAILNSILWLYCAGANRGKRMAYVISAIGWSLSLYCLTHMPVAYAVALTMNMFIFTYILYYHYGSFSLLFEQNKITAINVRDIAVIIILTAFLLAAAGYINALSMIVFEEYVSSILSQDISTVWSGILVYAIAPAIVEEIAFRGVIFQRLGNGKKAIIISAIIFSIGHMNFNQMSYAFVMGILFAIIYSITENLTMIICIHGLFNSFAVLSSIFKDTVVIKAIEGVNIGGYHVFSPTVLEAGHPSAKLLLIGGMIFLCSIGLIVVLLRNYNKDYELSPILGKEEKWKPGISFYLAAAICILSAVLMEVSL